MGGPAALRGASGTFRWGLVGKIRDCRDDPRVQAATGLGVRVARSQRGAPCLRAGVQRPSLRHLPESCRQTRRRTPGLSSPASAAILALPIWVTHTWATNFTWAYFAMLTLTSLFGLGFERLAATVIAAADRPGSSGISTLVVLRLATTPLRGRLAVDADVVRGCVPLPLAWVATLIWVMAALTSLVGFGALRALKNSTVEPSLLPRVPPRVRRWRSSPSPRPVGDSTSRWEASPRSRPSAPWSRSVRSARRCARPAPRLASSNSRGGGCSASPGSKWWRWPTSVPIPAGRPDPGRRSRCDLRDDLPCHRCRQHGDRQRRRVALRGERTAVEDPSGADRLRVQSLVLLPRLALLIGTVALLVAEVVVDVASFTPDEAHGLQLLIAAFPLLRGRNADASCTLGGARVVTERF